MATPPAEQRIYSIDSIRRGIRGICPDEYVALLHDNKSAKLDPCIIETVMTIYKKFFWDLSLEFDKAFSQFCDQDCSTYLSKKIAELQSNAGKIAHTVNDISPEDQQIYISIAERIQDLTFVSKFICSQRLVKDNHTCLASTNQLESELKNLHEKVVRAAGDHRLSLVRIEKIEQKLHALKTAFESNRFDQIAQLTLALDRDLL